MPECTTASTKDPNLLILAEFLLQFLSPLQISQILEQLVSSWESNKNVLWTGNIRQAAQEWADHRHMRTLSTALGHLSATGNNSQDEGEKNSKKARTDYMRGASALFALLITADDVVTILCPPPPTRLNPEGGTNIQMVELPILMGIIGGLHVPRIEFVHPMVEGAEDFKYQYWPQDELHTWEKHFTPRTVVPWLHRTTTPQRRHIEHLLETLLKTEDTIICHAILPQKQTTMVPRPKQKHNHKRTKLPEESSSAPFKTLGANNCANKKAHCNDPSSPKAKTKKKKKKKSKGNKPRPGTSKANACSFTEYDAATSKTGRKIFALGWLGVFLVVAFSTVGLARMWHGAFE